VPDPWYVAAVLAIGFVITVSLRAVPFAVLRPLSESRFVVTMAAWMPAGILAILAAVTLRSAGESGRVLPAALAAAVTVAVHLTCGRRTLLSVGAGTLTYVALVNLM